MGPDSDWDEDHLPQAVEFHSVTKYPQLYGQIGRMLCCLLLINSLIKMWKS